MSENLSQGNDLTLGYRIGAIRGRHCGPQFDHELLDFGAVFHDLGLTAKYRSRDNRFEIDSANAAPDFLRANDTAARRFLRTILQDPPAALPGGPAAGRVDLLTVLLHELGHIVGLPDDAATGGHG